MRNYVEIHTVVPTKAVHRIKRILGMKPADNTDFSPDFTADGIAHSLSYMGFGKGTYALNLTLWGPKDAKDTTALEKLYYQRIL